MSIYILRDPITLKIRYIGQTKNDLTSRLNQHMCDKAKNRRTQWMKELRKLGVKPLIEEIENVEVGSANQRKRYWIEHYRTMGEDLLNDSSLSAA